MFQTNHRPLYNILVTILNHDEKHVLYDYESMGQNWSKIGWTTLDIPGIRIPEWVCHIIHNPTTTFSDESSGDSESEVFAGYKKQVQSNPRHDRG